MSSRFQILQKDGLQRKIICPENSDLSYLSFSYLKTGAALSSEDSTDAEEWLFVLIKGKMEISIGASRYSGERNEGVFAQLPVAVYLPPQTEYRISCAPGTEVAAVSAPASSRFSPVLINSKTVKVQRAGKSNYCRTIRNIVPEDFPACTLVAGETVHDIGHWSCFPPHKHDKDRMPSESMHEELYFFKVEPEKTGFGMIRIFDENKDVAFPVTGNDVVTITQGYHPVAVAPGHRLYYFWALAGSKRPFQRYTHPDYLAYE